MYDIINLFHMKNIFKSYMKLYVYDFISYMIACAHEIILWCVIFYMILYVFPLLPGSMWSLPVQMQLENQMLLT